MIHRAICTFGFVRLGQPGMRSTVFQSTFKNSDRTLNESQDLLFETKSRTVCLSFLLHSTYYSTAGAAASLLLSIGSTSKRHSHCNETSDVSSNEKQIVKDILGSIPIIIQRIMRRIRNNDRPKNGTDSAYELALVSMRIIGSVSIALSMSLNVLISNKVPRDRIHIPLSHHQIMANLRLISKLSNKSKEHIYILNDVIPNILSFCDGSTLARAACVCKEWRDLCNRNELWENLCRQTFGVSAEELTPSPDPVKELYILSHLQLRYLCSSLTKKSMGGIRAVPNFIPMASMRPFM